MFQVSIAKAVSFTIRNTLRSPESSVACWAVSRAVNELEAIVVSVRTSAPTDPATSACLPLRKPAYLRTFSDRASNFLPDGASVASRPLTPPS